MQQLDLRASLLLQTPRASLEQQLAATGARGRAHTCRHACSAHAARTTSLLHRSAYKRQRPWRCHWLSCLRLPLRAQLFNTGNPLVQAAMFVLDRLASALLPRWLVTAHSRNMP